MEKILRSVMDEQVRSRSYTIRLKYSRNPAESWLSLSYLKHFEHLRTVKFMNDGL